MAAAADDPLNTTKGSTVLLNVGGKRFETTRTTLCSVGLDKLPVNNFFAALLNNSTTDGM